jgi:hypothetical protein
MPLAVASEAATSNAGPRWVFPFSVEEKGRMDSVATRIVAAVRRSLVAGPFRSRWSQADRSTSRGVHPEKRLLCYSPCAHEGFH